MTIIDTQSLVQDVEVVTVEINRMCYCAGVVDYDRTVSLLPIS